MKKTALALISGCILSGCGGDIQSVKDSTFNGYESTTIGQAFDNYSYKNKTTWTEFETKNGQKKVKIFVDLAFKDIYCKDKCNDPKNLPGRYNPIGGVAYSEWMTHVKNDKKEEICKASEADIKNASFEILLGINKDASLDMDQFTLNYVINSSDESFDCNHTAQVVVDVDKGHKIITSVLDAVYEDVQVY